MKDKKEIKSSLDRFRRYGRLNAEEPLVSKVFEDHDGVEVDPEEIGLNSDAFKKMVKSATEGDDCP